MQEAEEIGAGLCALCVAVLRGVLSPACGGLSCGCPCGLVADGQGAGGAARGLSWSVCAYTLHKIVYQYN